MRYIKFVLTVCGLVALFLSSSTKYQSIRSSVIGQWQSVTPLPTSRMDYALVRVNNYVYILGGCVDCALGPTQMVERAEIQPNGDLNSWQNMTQLTEKRQGLAAVNSGNYLYVLGGFDGCARNNVERALINEDGSLGNWQALTPMTVPRFRFAAVVIGNYLYVVGGFGVSEINSVERAIINIDGTLGTWESVACMVTGRMEFALLKSNNYLYVLGGEGRPDGFWVSLDSIERASINPDNSIGTWQEIATLPTGRHSFSATIISDSLYVMGGSAGTTLDRVDKASIYPDGSINDWKSMPSLITPRYLHNSVETGHYIYVIGGYSQSGSLQSIERAPIRNFLYLSIILNH